MHFLAGALLSIVILLGVIIDTALAQDNAISTIFTTVSYSSPEITRTATTTITTYGPGSSTISTSTSTIIHLPTLVPISAPSPAGLTSTILPSTIAKTPSIHASSKLIGLLFAIGSILLIFFAIVFALVHRRHKKIQQKRIADWIDASALHDRYSVVGNCGTPAAEMKAFRAMGIDLETEKNTKDEATVVQDDGRLQVPGKAVVMVGNVPFLIC